MKARKHANDIISYVRRVYTRNERLKRSNAVVIADRVRPKFETEYNQLKKGIVSEFENAFIQYATSRKGTAWRLFFEQIMKDGMQLQTISFPTDDRDPCAQTVIDDFTEKIEEQLIVYETRLNRASFNTFQSIATILRHDFWAFEERLTEIGMNIDDASEKILAYFNDIGPTYKEIQIWSNMIHLER
jgi:hypothetical protein